MADLTAASPAGAPSAAPTVALVGAPFVIGGVLRALRGERVCARVFCGAESAEEKLGAAGLAAGGAPAEPAPEVRFVRGELDSEAVWEELLRGAQAAALLSAVSLDGRAWEPEAHLATAARFIQGVEKWGVERRVYLSALAADAKARARVLREALQAEKLLQERGGTLHVFRVAPLMGPGDALLTRAAAGAARAGPIQVVWGYGATLLQPLHVDDLGRGLARALLGKPEPLRPGTCALAGPDTLTVMELLDRALRRRGRAPVKLHVPFFLLNAWGLFLRDSAGRRFRDRVAVLLSDHAAARNDAAAVLGPGYLLTTVAQAEAEVAAEFAGGG